MLKILPKGLLVITVTLVLMNFVAPSIAQQSPDVSQDDTASENTVIHSIKADSNAFIRDDLFVFMHTGPTRNYRILGSIVAGEPITVLAVNKETEFSQIKDSENRVGWVESRFLSEELPAQHQLQLLSEQLTNTAKLESDLSQKNQRLSSQNEVLSTQVNDLTQRLSEAELARANAEQALHNADQTNDMQWLVRGGLITGGGVLLGVLLTFLPKKRRREDNWM